MYSQIKATICDPIFFIQWDFHSGKGQRSYTIGRFSPINSTGFLIFVLTLEISDNRISETNKVYQEILPRVVIEMYVLFRPALKRR